MPDNQMPTKVWLRLCGGGVSMPGGRAYQSVAGGSREAAHHAAYVRSDIAERLAEALEECLREHGGFTIKGECEKRARSALSAWKEGR